MADDLRTALQLLRPRRAAAGHCPHPPTRLYAWTARDDTSPGGKLAVGGEVFCIACMDCGAVLAGAATLNDKEAEP
jgi:hypothetical protein